MIVPTNWRSIPLRTRKSRHRLILAYYASLGVVTFVLGWITHLLNAAHPHRAEFLADSSFYIFLLLLNELNHFHRERDDSAPDDKFSWDPYPVQALNPNGKLRSFLFKTDERDKEMDYIVYRRAYKITVLLMLYLLAIVYFRLGWITAVTRSTRYLLLIFFTQLLVSLVPVIRIWIQPDDIGDGTLHLISADETPKEVLP